MDVPDAGQLIADLEDLRRGLDRLTFDLGLARSLSFPSALRCREVDLPLGQRTLVMGIVNVTPDSFSGDGLVSDPAAAIARAHCLVDEGADVVDIGGESTRPGAEPISADEELRRVLPVIEAMNRSYGARPDLAISVDTSKPEVARAALEAGAHIVNDVTGLQRDLSMAEVIAQYDAVVVVMHMLGQPRTMQDSPHYTNLLGEIASYLNRSVEIAAGAGIPRERVIIDPGIGFGKTWAHNLQILRRLRELRALGQPILIGTSRKAFIGGVLGGLPPEERLEGTAATVALAIAGGVDLVRVHDVKAMVRVARMADAIVRGWSEP